MTRVAALLGLLAAAMLFATASASAHADRPSRAAGYVTLDNATFADYSAEITCPNGYSGDCFQFIDQAAIPGLGFVTEQHVVAVSGSAQCVLVQFSPAVLTVAHKGTLTASFETPACNSLPSTFTITGGTGDFTGAGGGGEFSSEFVGQADTLQDTILEGYWYADVWSGTLPVPNYTVDSTPPVMTGVRSRVVRVAKRVKRTRVHFAVTAQDNVDGKVRVYCAPRSGSFFKLGRTKVTCSSSDYSANTTTRKFTVRVVRR